MDTLQFYEIGNETSKIDVKVSYYIIKLFSDGLYSSPNKALEELVSNAWDAGAENVHVILPADRNSLNAKIIVVDDGCGMDESGLRQHWLLGDSKKRDPNTKTPKNRKQIGKFGIGKLATYVLASRLTHITKSNGRYYSTSMDYNLIDQGAGDATSEKLIKLPLRELTVKEAQTAIENWADSKKLINDLAPIKLFGDEAPKSWTVAVMSELKPLAKDLSEGKLRWILETAMPLGDDFGLYLNGQRIHSSKIKEKKVGTWVIGRDVGILDCVLPKPAPDDIETVEDFNENEKSFDRYGIFHPVLQRVTGYIEIYEDELTGKSENWGSSNGFFVYVHGRRINVEDPGFGIDRNKLQHGTFSRFRIVVHMDGLDNELRSSREGVREGDPLKIARDILIAGFNYARSRLKKHLDQSNPGVAMALRVADSPSSLTTRPILGLITKALNNEADPRYFHVPSDLPNDKKQELLDTFSNPDKEGFQLIESSEIKAGDPRGGVATYDVLTRILRINSTHPLVAHFLNEFQANIKSLHLELFAISEVLLEAQLYQLVNDHDQIQGILERRDQLFRHLAKTTGRKNAFIIAQDLEEAARDKSALEKELVNAFTSLGFEAVPIGNSGKPDGIAVAYLSATKNSQRKYKVSLEAKSKEATDGKVSGKSVNTAAITRQRDDYECDHAIVVGPDFPASRDGKSALEKQILDSKGYPEKTITLIRVSDLARLVRIQPQKRIGLNEIRSLFFECRMPEESEAWVTKIENMSASEPHYRQILEGIWKLQKEEPESQIEYGKLKTVLRYEFKLSLMEEELANICNSMMGMAGSSYIYASKKSVELSQHPNKVLSAIQAVADSQSKPSTKKATGNESEN